MINIDHDGRVCQIEGPATVLLVSMLLSVRLGNQHAAGRFFQGTALPTGEPVPEGYHAFTMIPGMTYNILREADKFSRTFTDRVVASVMVDHERRSWIGRPGEWRPIGEQTPTVWARLLAD